MFEKIEKQDINIDNFKPEETKVILQRHEKYERDFTSEKAGHLTPEGIKSSIVESSKIIQGIIDRVPEEERDNLFFLVLSSDTTYGKGARSMETAQIVVNQLKSILVSNSINQDNLLNISHDYRDTEKGAPRPVLKLREPLMFEETPDFVNFLRNKYPNTKDFWMAFETDSEKDKRIEMMAEGHEDIADRVQKFLKFVKRYSQIFHHTKPNSRLVIWCTSHYDTISPYTKKYILGQNVTENELPVDYGSGIVIGIEEDGSAKIKLDKEYTINI